MQQKTGQIFTNESFHSSIQIDTKNFCLHYRFQLYYFSDAEFKKEERKDTVLTIDTRNTKTRTLNETNNFDDADLEDGIQEPPLQLAIKTK